MTGQGVAVVALLLLLAPAACLAILLDLKRAEARRRAREARPTLDQALRELSRSIDDCRELLLAAILPAAERMTRTMAQLDQVFRKGNR